jgi:hypothetical protein
VIGHALAMDGDITAWWKGVFLGRSSREKETSMKAAIFQGPGKIEVGERPDSTIKEPTDAIWPGPGGEAPEAYAW